MQTSLPQKSFDPWQATQALTGLATRVMGSEDYLGRNTPEVGTRVGDHAFELFAVCPPAEALQLQFETQQPTFIAIHDLGAAHSARFLAELSLALRLPLQTLSIRRQGVGVTLATLKFIELPSPQGAPLRLYATAVDADTTTRRLVADVLLAFSRLGVLLVGAVAPHAVTAQFAPLRDRLLTTPWNNRQLLLVPVAPPSPELADRARQLVTTSMAPGTDCAALFPRPVWRPLRLRHQRSQWRPPCPQRPWPKTGRPNPCRCVPCPVMAVPKTRSVRPSSRTTHKLARC